MMWSRRLLMNRRKAVEEDKDGMYGLQSDS